MAQSGDASESSKKRNFLDPRRLLRRNNNDSKNMPMVPVDIPTLLTDLELDSSPDMEKLMAIVPGIRAAVSSYGEQSCKWEFTAQKRLENLVGQLKLHNTNLEQLRSMHIQHKVVRIRSFFLKYEGSTEYQNTATLSSQKEILYFMVPFPRNWDFIGESKVLSWFKDKDPSVNRDSSCVALVGLAGIRYASSTFLKS